MGMFLTIETILVAALLLAAAWRDCATRSIPDLISITIMLLGLMARSFADWSAPLLSLAVAAGLFLLLTLAHAKAMLGGADVKLMAAIACGLSPLQTYHFITSTAIAGGVLAAIHLVLRHRLRNRTLHKPPPRGARMLYRVFTAERWRIARRGPLPYGVAIACGGILVLLRRGAG